MDANNIYLVNMIGQGLDIVGAVLLAFFPILYPIIPDDTYMEEGFSTKQLTRFRRDRKMGVAALMLIVVGFLLQAYVSYFFYTQRPAAPNTKGASSTTTQQSPLPK